MKLNYKRTIYVGFAFFIILAFWQAYDAIIPLMLTNHFGLPQWASGAVMALDNVLAVFMLPLFGAISDRTKTKMGKRTPFILIGTLIAVVAFIFLAVVDGIQLSSIGDGIKDAYAAQIEARDAAYTRLSDALASGNTVLEDSARLEITAIEEAIKGIRAETFEIVKTNVVPLVIFILVLLVVLVAMAIFRSPAVALMPDVTVKPLRSKGNAIINLVGTAGAIIVLGLGMLFGTSKAYMSYVGYVGAVVAAMIIALILFKLLVKENEWAEEMEKDTVKYGIEEKEETNEGTRKLTRSEKFSLIFILASVALWYIGYNSITSKYSVYASNELGFDYNITLIVAQAAAIVAYIPVGIISSKIGRKKSILAGIIMLASAFFLGTFITPISPEILMFPLFALAGIGWATINVNSFPMVVELAKGGEVGKYTGYYYTASMAAQIIAPTLSGVLYEINMRAFFFPFGTVFVILSFVTMLFVKHGDSIPERQGALESLGGADD